MIGAVNHSCSRSVQARLRQTGLRATDDELKVFYNLCPGRVHYRGQSRKLYFVDSPYESISEIIMAVFAGLGETPMIEQLYMDEHHYIKAAKVLCLRGRDRVANTLLVALRLKGIHLDRVD